ncbi:hypothetical protein J7T55_009751 [Diaporthe amygdali]|uniref:uncharacterized protein n=1 Tax=Phomopsis amygdali TaxID=1214568 RepID=UPI0022FE1239|nr:uncharacterized protein J7T55_009751 [Diaporthe amygdali]KAJ0116601.1 hypothetical protein J7T55_009751 [Diaporthe amygdali]
MMNKSLRPFTLIVPGGLTPASIYDPLVEEVTKRGHNIRAVPLPSVRLPSEAGPVREPPTMYEDAAHIAKEIEALADAGRDVIVVSQSYGGVPATESEHGWIFCTDPIQAASLTIGEELPEEGQRLASSLAYHSSTSFTNPLTYAGYKDVAASYLFCEKDILIPPESQTDMIELIERESGNKVDVMRVQAGHAPNITAFGEVVDWIVLMAEKAMADSASES